MPLGPIKKPVPLRCPLLSVASTLMTAPWLCSKTSLTSRESESATSPPKAGGAPASDASVIPSAANVRELKAKRRLITDRTGIEDIARVSVGSRLNDLAH